MSLVDEERLLPNEPTRYTKVDMDRMLIFCYQQGASDVTLQTAEPIIAEIYGKLVKVTRRKLSNAEIGDMLNDIYGPNGTTQLLSGKDVDTHYEIRPSRTERYRFRVNGTACQVDAHDAIQMTFRTIPSTPPSLESLDVPPNLIPALTPEEGVVYVTGSTGSGKSTLLAAIIRYICEQTESHRKILTYEAPIEFIFDAISKPSCVVSQSEIPRHLPDFAAGVRNALRRKPRLILVGEARDPETISAVMEAALTGHPVYTTLHSNGVAEVMRRLVTTFPAAERHGRTLDLIETIRLIIWQKLVPKTDGKRIALREYLVFDEYVRDRLTQENPDNVTKVTRKLLKERGQPMLVEAEKYFQQGLIYERDYRLLTALSDSADKDAGIV